MHHSQQDLKNRVSQGRIKVSRLQESQETRFLVLVQDLSNPRRSSAGHEETSETLPETFQRPLYAVFPHL